MKKNTIAAEGKTKIIRMTDEKYVVCVESKADITAGDGARRDIIKGKDFLATKTTCNCFLLLRDHGIPNHFIGYADNSFSFYALECAMIPIESVVRRIATGSYLKRNPETVEGEIFPELVLELFWKDDAGHDPMMVWNEAERFYHLHSASKPVADDTAVGAIGEIRCKGGMFADRETVCEMQRLTREVFLVLEEAWKKQDVALVDLKIEFGFDVETGQLLVADVIDNDSWRIWPAGDKTQAKDKQVYRDLKERTSRELGKIKENYAWVAKKTRAFVE